MNSRFTRLPMVIGIAFAATTAANAQTNTLIVEGDRTLGGETQLSPLASPAPAADAAEWLRRLNGVEAIRMGGHGLDPVIRGQQGNALNVLIDGGYVFGGCPNRMDPPTAYAPLQSFDRVIVSRGVTTLQHGAGGSGGTIEFVREAPTLTADETYQGNVGAKYGENGDSTGLYANLSAGNKTGYLRFFGERQTANDYEDGDGRRIHSGFETTSGGLTLGLTPQEGTEIALGVESVRERDVKFAGSGMDSPESDNDTVRLRLDHAFSDTLRVENRLQYTRIDHVMDNYSLRMPPKMPNGMPMKMRSPTESDTFTLKNMWEQQFANSDLRLGINVLQNKRDAFIVNDSSNTVIFNSWPDVTTRQSGVFAELDHYLNQDVTLSGGFRVDYSQASADAAYTATEAGNVAANFYQNAYGVEGNLDNDSVLLGGFLRGELQLAPNRTLYASLSRAERDADATERYFAKGDWVGNPSLDAETHQQIDIGLVSQQGNVGWEMSAYADRVNDYILRDRQTISGMNKGNPVSVYRNIDATLYGVELSGEWRWAPTWETRGQLSWVRGDNLDDGGTLANIAPLRGQLAQFYLDDNWEAGLTARFSDSQSRLALGEEATAGYVLLDFEAAWYWNNVAFRAGALNLLDKTYSDFLNRNRNANDPFLAGDSASAGLPLNEPGRSVWLGVDYAF
ncbi:TonB-dependent receptor [Halomonas vilamensis]|uniref:TonB-dependent receptor n=1 Tax=Vreelandella vilamensis TaxID=531309 RepID=A0ABU1H5P4_9GAMM|nr:TonB-dependent receptor [Halomonas vilamensis]MDR5899621.1 TonB-dependent receptor [Halomonas vilamensis]